MGNLNIPIDVRTRLDDEGNLYPVSCTLHGETFQVFGVGRRWKAEDGEHLLVMFPRQRAVELMRNAEDSWFLVKDHSNFGDKLV